MLDHAVVIGGGFSGLVYAITLSKFYREVTILESDAYPTEGPLHRSGIPQGRHIHTLLLKGRQILQEMIPDFEQRLDAFNVPVTDYMNDCVLHTHVGRLPRFPSGVEIRPCQRPVIDTIVREHLATLTNVKIIQDARVTRLLLTEDRVSGLCAKINTQTAESSIAADLVIDCSGRSSKLHKWLGEIGVPAPKTSRVIPHLGYASRLYEIPAMNSSHQQQPWKAVEVATHAPHNPRAAGFWQVEDGKWLLTLIGTAKQYPPSDEEGFLAFAKQLNTPIIFNAIKSAKPLSPIRAHRGTDNHWRHYEKLRDLPAGLLVGGDAYCCFNPYYGQGMSIVSMMAQSLAESIRSAQKRHPNNQLAFQLKLRKTYFKKAQPILFVGWTMATFEDSRWPTTEGLKPSWYSDIFFNYLDSVLTLSLRDHKIAKILIEITNMTAKPQQIVHPYILMQLLQEKLGLRTPSTLDGNLDSEDDLMNEVKT